MEVTVMKLGEDFQICLAGGEKPHIGCVVQAVPRESLTGDGSWSATSSVWNRTGHKDEVLCRMLAEKICCACRTVTVCTPNFKSILFTRLWVCVIFPIEYVENME